MHLFLHIIYILGFSHAKLLVIALKATFSLLIFDLCKNWNLCLKFFCTIHPQPKIKLTFCILNQWAWVSPLAGSLS